MSLDWSHLPSLSREDRLVVVRILEGLPAEKQQALADELAGALRANAIRQQWPGWLMAVAKRARSGTFLQNYGLSIRQARQRARKEAELARIRQAEQDRLRDPEVRNRALAALADIAANLGLPPPGKA